MVSFAGCFSSPTNDLYSGELLAFAAALNISWEQRASIKHVFTNSRATIYALSANHSPLFWRSIASISNTRFLLNMNGNPAVHITPETWLAPAISLASLGHNHHTLSLFLSGRDLPFWIMKSFHAAGFSFH